MSAHNKLHTGSCNQPIFSRQFMTQLPCPDSKLETYNQDAQLADSPKAATSV